MFRFADMNNVEVTSTSEGIIEGIVTKQLPTFVRIMGRKQEGAIALYADSLDAFFEYLPVLSQRYRHERSSERFGSGSFQKMESYEEAIDTFRNHPEDIRTFTPLDETLFQPHGGTEVFYDTDGSFIDMGRFMEGVPECFGENINGNVNNLFATIVVNLSASASIPQRVLRARGERLTRLVDWLENQNIRTEVVALCTQNCCHVEIVVKRFEDTLDIDRIAVVGHPDFYRRMIFRVIEVSDTFTPGYGTASCVRNHMMNPPKIEGEGIVILTENAYDVEQVTKSFDECERTITQELAEGNKWLTMTL